MQLITAYCILKFSHLCNNVSVDISHSGVQFIKDENLCATLRMRTIKDTTIFLPKCIFPTYDHRAIVYLFIYLFIYPT